MSSPPSLKNYTLQAVAGAGKTRHLIEEVFQTLENHLQKKEKAPRIVITTFTRKATQEIKERMMARAIQNKNWDLLKLLFNPSQIQISTLHGVLFSFLKRYVLPQSIEFMNTFQTEFLSRSTVRDLFLKNSSYYQLFRFYSFNKLCEMCREYDEWTRQEPQLQFLKASEIQKNWIHKVEEKLENIFQKDHSCFLEFKKDPLEFKYINLKNEFPKGTDSEVKTEFKKYFKECHPRKAQMFEENYKLFFNLAESFKIKWNELKNKNSYLQIQDLELLTLESFQKNPSYIQSFSKEWDEWFIDEYQDISLIQEKILKHLFKNAKRVWTVGDPQQSIYSFRDAEPQVFQKRKEFGNFEEKTRNFRSSPTLVSFFNNFFKESDFYLPMKSHKEHNPSNEPAVHFLQHETPQDQNQMIALRLNEILKKEGILNKSICILFTQNKDVKETHKFLERLKFPVQLHLSDTLKRQILDLLFLLRFLSQPLDNLNLLGLLRTPFFFLKEDHIASLRKNTYIWWNLKKENHPVAGSLKELLKMSEQKGYSETLLYFLEKHFLLNISFHQDSTGEYEHKIWEFLGDLKEREQHSNFQHTRFIDQILNKTEFHHPDRTSSQTGMIREGFIQVMTIHQSKGLEFDYVILPDLVSRLKFSGGDSIRFSHHFEQKRWSFYLKDSEDSPIYPLEQLLWHQEKKEKEFQEKDRLLYVAMTRAKENLTFIYPRNFINKKNTWLSRFDYFKNVHNQRENWVDFREFTEVPQQACLIQPPFFPQPLTPYRKESSVSSQQITSLENNIPLKLSVLEGNLKGISLHRHLQTLSIRGDSFLKQIQNPQMKEALTFVRNLKIPPMQKLLKQKSEWGFVHKENNSLLKNIRIDLWGEVDQHIWIIDYKSSEKFSPKTWDQLESYAQVLRKINSQKKISICAILPFSKEVKIRSYQK